VGAATEVPQSGQPRGKVARRNLACRPNGPGVPLASRDSQIDIIRHRTRNAKGARSRQETL